MMKFLIPTSILLLVVMIPVPPANSSRALPECVGIQKYQKSISLIKDAWLSLDAISEHDSDKNKIQSNLKQVLVSMYEAEHKAATASWLAKLNNKKLTKEIQRQKNANALDFVEAIKYDLASISDKGVLRISKGGATVTYIAPESPTYRDFLAAVGQIEPGFVKEVPPVPEGLFMAERQRREKARSISQPTK